MVPVKTSSSCGGALVVMFEPLKTGACGTGLVAALTRSASAASSAASGSATGDERPGWAVGVASCARAAAPSRSATSARSPEKRIEARYGMVCYPCKHRNGSFFMYASVDDGKGVG